MSGICGFFAKDTNADAAELCDLANALLAAGSMRGVHSMGCSWAGFDGKMRTVRRLLNGNNNNSWLKLSQSWPRVFLGHNGYFSFYSGGDLSQPLEFGSTAFAHDGFVARGADARAAGSFYGVETRASSPSEIILMSLLKRGHITSLEHFGNVLSDVLEELSQRAMPSYAFGMLEAEVGLFASRDGRRPLWVFDSDLASGFASTKAIIERAGLKERLPRLEIAEAAPFYAYEFGEDVLRVPLAFQGAEEMKTKRTGSLINPAWRMNEYFTQSGKDLASDTPIYRSGDCRLAPREAFKRYAAATGACFEVDPNYPMLEYLFETQETRHEQELFLCWFYGAIYHAGGMLWGMFELPEFELLDTHQFSSWVNQLRPQLLMAEDVKFNRGRLGEMFESYVEFVGGQRQGAQAEYFKQATSRNNKRESFQALYHDIKSRLLGFGRFAAYITTEALARDAGLALEADDVFFKDAESPRKGMLHVLGRPDLLNKNLTSSELAWLDAEANKLLAELTVEYPECRIDKWLFESILCGFKGYFRQHHGRYIGFYFDRMASEFIAGQRRPATVGVPWVEGWRARRAMIFWEYLGEMKNPQILNVDIERSRLLRKTGEMVGLWPAIKRGICPARPVCPRPGK